MGNKAILATALAIMLASGGFASAKAAEECTVGAAMGNATADGRPISWKDRDNGSDPVHFVRYGTYSGGKYGILGMGFGSGTTLDAFDLKMGVNDAGLSLQNSVCENMDGVYDYDDFKQYLLSQRSSVADVRAAVSEVYGGSANYWRHWPDSSGPAICSMFSDAQGKAALWELNQHTSPFYYEYNPENANRLTQFPKQFIVRSNTAHLNSTQKDDTSGDTRYTVAKNDLQNLANSGTLSVKNWIQVVARDGSPGYDFLPNNDTTQAFMIVHGVNAGEDARIVTAWLGLGNPDYTIGVPAWTAQKTDLSPRVTIGNNTSIGYYADQLMNKANSASYDEYINGLFSGVENNIFEAVDLARTKWLSQGFVLAEATRINKETAEDAYQTMKSMAAGSGTSLNTPPSITALNASANGLAVSFSASASDSNGSIASYEWDFGDSTALATTAAPTHAYASAGTYLVRVAAVDNNGARNAKWKYITIGGAPTTKPGDANKDNKVDDLDYIIWANNYGLSGTQATWDKGNFNADTAVDDLDYVIWSKNYGT